MSPRRAVPKTDNAPVNTTPEEKPMDTTVAEKSLPDQLTEAMQELDRYTHQTLESLATIDSEGNSVPLTQEQREAKIAELTAIIDEMEYALLSDEEKELRDLEREMQALDEARKKYEAELRARKSEAQAKIAEKRAQIQTDKNVVAAAKYLHFVMLEVQTAGNDESLYAALRSGSLVVRDYPVVTAQDMCSEKTETPTPKKTGTRVPKVTGLQILYARWLERCGVSRKEINVLLGRGTDVCDSGYLSNLIIGRQGTVDEDLAEQFNMVHGVMTPTAAKAMFSAEYDAPQSENA